MNDWKIFTGIPNAEPHDRIEDLPPAPSWRPFGEETGQKGSRRKHKGETFIARPEEKDMVNAALHLRRPLLLTGAPGTGKSSLIYAVARELKLGEVLYWPITTRTNLKDGLYSYDAIGRLQEAKPQSNSGKGAKTSLDELKKIEKYITLGPLGTALLKSDRPRALLIDEIDKSDIDLPNDLLTLFEEGSFEIPELVRIKKDCDQVRVRTAYSDENEEITAKDLEADIKNGRVSCKTFPFVILTSNGERDFPAPFLRRCLRLHLRPPNEAELKRIVQSHFQKEIEIAAQKSPAAKGAFTRQVNDLIARFIEKREAGVLSTDQLLNALYMVTREKSPKVKDKEKLIERLLSDLSGAGDMEKELEE